MANDARVKIVPIIPDGIQVSTASSDLYAQVTVKEYEKAVIKISKNDIKLLNAAENLEYDVVIEDMTITVQGKQEQLAGLSINDFTITADVKNLEKGTHTVKVKIECSKNVVSVKPSTEEIEITVNK